MLEPGCLGPGRSIDTGHRPTVYPRLMEGPLDAHAVTRRTVLRPMQALLDLSRDYDIDVSIVFKPHPDDVFATDRLSDHSRRRAWDIWAVNGQAVIAESTPDALVDGFLRDAKDAGPRTSAGRGRCPALGSSRTGRTGTTATSRSTATPDL